MCIIYVYDSYISSLHQNLEMMSLEVNHKLKILSVTSCKFTFTLLYK